MPNLRHFASAAAAAACLALAVPAAASAAPAATQAPASLARCTSGVIFSWPAPGRVQANGWISCPRPLPELNRIVDATLYRNGVAVQYGRSDCNGFGSTCTAHSPRGVNGPGIQTWCAVSSARYDVFYHAVRKTCWRG
ncbi:MAG: hypothetical protein J2P32_12245 [Actinobacteria bacterium]|nr:hypothetical protein [Actinomycetota bacterium]